MAREPATAQQPVRSGLPETLHKTARLGRRLTVQTLAEACGHLRHIGFQARAPVVALRGEQRVGREHGGLDGRANAFSALRVGKTGGVANEQQAVVDHLARCMWIKQVGVAVKLRGRITWNPAPRFKAIAKCRDMLGKFVIVFATETDIEKVALAKDPAIALQVIAEIKFGAILGHVAGLLLGGVHFKLDFLRGDNLFVSAEVGAEVTRHRAEMSAGPDHQRRAKLAVDHPVIAFVLHALERLTQQRARAATLQQIIVKLEAADTVTHGRVVRGVYFLVADGAGNEAPYRLENAAARVFGGIEFERLDYRRGDPAGTGFVARKGFFIEDQDIQASCPELPGERRTRRTAADNQDVTGFHG